MKSINEKRPLKKYGNTAADCGRKQAKKLNKHEYLSGTLNNK